MTRTHPRLEAVVNTIKPTVTDEMIEQAARTLADEGADTEGGWHSWRCFDKVRYPEPCDCTEHVARAALEATAPLIAGHALRDAAEALEALPSAAAKYGRYDSIGARKGRARQDERSVIAHWLRFRADQIEAGRQGDQP